MVKWIMACVTSTSFSLAINGNLFGYFKGKRGLRQGDPMSPYLFTLVMEVLILILQKQVSLSSKFRFHSKCEAQRIINICFADDLFLFARGDHGSAKVILEASNGFKNMSGLVPSMSKSTVFFANVPNSVKHQIRSIMPFEEGQLPVRYLGVPLISSRLSYKDCIRLVENMERRITDWKSKCLSFGGRLQLIRSVLSSMHIYWAGVFTLPKRIICELESMMRRFLWAQGNDIKGKAKVRWEKVSLPKKEGGLGIRSIADMNNALMVSHIWSLLTMRESLWVKWIHSYRIRGRNFWDIPLRGNVSWTWRKLLNLRPIIQQFVWVKLGDGTRTSLWFDKWDVICPLSSFITPRAIANAGFTLNMKVADVYNHGEWLWPDPWITRYPILLDIQHFNPRPYSDKVVWKSSSGKELDYCASSVWNDIRTAQDEVPWSDMVWFPQSIPRHSFFMWLLVNKKLKTQDIMARWFSLGNMNFNLMCCSLCTSGPDSHEHLFFECPYSTRVWKGVKEIAGLKDVTNSWESIYNHLVQLRGSKNAKHVIGKLVVSAAGYFVWQERNARLFSPKKRSADRLTDIILATVRMKLQTMRFKRTNQVDSILQEWSLPRGLVVEDDDCG
ncbi:putative RNA-directed DNA polymerase [Helianthus annuus]|nr:putative RNA-directed DNA polymerase [Helianthus annuus]